jgi:UDP-N-acetylmuramyl pentapeptide phosphotransferase/UDP-N-acetylglucosamine-1-phosphate transferase
MDTLRVITIRTLNGRSPFYPDTNHTHHRLLELFPNHIVVTTILVAGNVVVIGIAFWFNSIAFNITLQFLLVFCIGALMCLIPSLVLRIKKNSFPRLNDILKEFT